MNQHDPNRESLVLAALKLEPFLDEIVFPGGATVGLLIAGTGIGRIRITRDVDVIVENFSGSAVIPLSKGMTQ